jgi:hypothetical protein
MRDFMLQAAKDNESGQASSTRIAILISSATLSLSTLVLTVAVLWEPALVPALSVAAGALGGMSGLAYTAGRAWSPNQRPTRNFDHVD